MSTPLLRRGVYIPSSWARRKERSSAWLLWFMARFSRICGRRVSRVLLYVATWYFLLTGGAARRASRNYLRRVLGREPAVADLFAHFWSFSSTVHDRIYLLGGRWDLFDVRIHNQDLMDAAVARGSGAFLIGAHLGSFEVLRAAGRSNAGLRIVMAMYEDNARKLNAALAMINADAGQDIVPLGHPESMMAVGEQLAAGAVVGMLADRFLSEGSGSCRRFLGDMAQWPDGPFRMAAVLRQPVLFMAGLYLGGNRYELRFERLADFSRAQTLAEREALTEQAMQRYVALLEENCRYAPYNWFNFFEFWP
ncbi:MAG TPA: hypothetical protein VFN52_01805, partial [Acidiferrobacteraceae bacterium]|nr:hypothetical protein [Acidiferrobacteraceae bacterium]